MLFWSLLACLPESSDPAQVEVLDNPYHDWDEDGFLDGDCDDNNAAIVETEIKRCRWRWICNRYSLQSICSSNRRAIGVTW